MKNRIEQTSRGQVGWLALFQAAQLDHVVSAIWNTIAARLAKGWKASDIVVYLHIIYLWKI